MQNSSLLRADLGPTNTGKTHHAIDRLLQFRSGMIGLPLRLLAREVYDRLAEKIDKQYLALITGEERVIGAKTRYWVSTTEAMPRDIHVEIVIVDEVQLAGDMERGHIFTDRLLNMRGQKETLFLGSHAMRPILQNLLPDLHIETRPRLSRLSYEGRKKLSNLPARSAIIAFSAEEIYATAEFLRRSHGGAAVVMGALSPRTRNAQVDLYQSGKVDYIVATDAIGMGLNLDISHVFFAGTEKFDGKRHRHLYPFELAQIAGRAGRFSKDGQFGTTTQAEELSPQTINAIENHQFAPVKQLNWRNSKLNFMSIDALLQSLEMPSPNPQLARAREADDLRALRHLAQLPRILELTRHPRHVELLWNVCGLPDFPKFSAGEHLAMVERIYLELRSDSQKITEEYIESEVQKIEKPHHDVEILGRKLAQIRTWRYIAQRNDWLEHASTWRKRTADIEDALSDKLHNALMSRFVDERTSTLKRRLKEKERIMAEVNAEGQVSIDGNYVGELKGFQFALDKSASGDEAKTIAQAAKEALQPVFHLRTDHFYNATDRDITLNAHGTIFWNEAPIGTLKKGAKPLTPQIVALTDEIMPAELREKVERRLGHWIERQTAELFAPLYAIENDETLTGLVRGVGFQIVENLGIIPRKKIADDVKALTQDERAFLRKHGVRFGQYNLFIPVLLKPAPTELRIVLSYLWNEEEDPIAPPPPGLVTIPKDESYKLAHYTQAGFYLAGDRAIRVDMLERTADLLRNAPKDGFEATPDMLSITGLSLEGFAGMLVALGYQADKAERPREKPTKEEIDAATAEGREPQPGNETYYTFRYMPRASKPAQGQRPQKAKKAGGPKGKTASAKPKRVEKPIDPDSPFAALAALKGKS